MNIAIVYRSGLPENRESEWAYYLAETVLIKHTVTLFSMSPGMNPILPFDSALRSCPDVILTIMGDTLSSEELDLYQLVYRTAIQGRILFRFVWISPLVYDQLSGFPSLSLSGKEESVLQEEILNSIRINLP